MKKERKKSLPVRGCYCVPFSIVPTCSFHADGVDALPALRSLQLTDRTHPIKYLEFYHTIPFQFYSTSPYKTEDRSKIKMIMIVIDDIPIGTHTGAIQGRGIRKSTSIDFRLGGHLIKI